ncbi:hypothetical protein [Bacillus phage SDFMU_Pbc]|uniref:Uncharacterized protein n=1 Tax=Bacillus phage SDFMU_Pbc TaxID=3076135 RepID=A0AA96R2Q2_9CAUD|nr:hypothetical protein [Bacillus phage SDFMU_Pbc]
MKLVNEEKFEAWKNINDDNYGKTVFEYAEGWADLMESLIEEGKQVKDIAQETYSSITENKFDNPAIFRATGLVLVRQWVHGNELKDWYTNHEWYNLGRRN